MGKKVLVIDDAGVVRQMNSITLRKEGFDVVEAVNGKDALSKILETRFDLVVTDINMPEMDGVELIKQIRGMKDHKFMPIIVISTLSQEEKVREGKTAGASGWIFKPYKAHQLIDSIRKFIV